MKLPPPTIDDAVFVRRNVESAIRIGVLAFLVVWSFRIIRPFFEPVMWGVIIAVAVFPAYSALAARLGNRRKLSAALLVVVAMAALLIPSVHFFGDTVDGIEHVAKRLEAGTLTIPPPSEKVRDWPLIGGDVDEVWQLASTNLKAALNRFRPQLEGISKRLLSAGAGLGLGILEFFISIIIAGVFLVAAGSGKAAAVRIGQRFAGDDGAGFVVLAEKTIRSVAIGVLGVATIQSVLGGLGMAVAGVPGAALWALLILFVAIVQLPVMLVLGPIALYVFSAESTVTAVIFLVWAVLVSFSDTVLKPLLLGRGVEVPTLVILIGAIGGLVSSGIIGLFLGAVVLALVYQLFVAWLGGGAAAAGGSSPPAAKPAPETS
jgi:predicted PurR-regulated permease PerM